MIIPIRCFTCGKAIAPIYLKYINELDKKGQKKQSELWINYFDKTPIRHRPMIRRVI